MKAIVNRIIEFSNVDGPGNRLAIFFQGCPFRCQYCHNPETLALCNNCGDCVAGCPADALQLVENKVVYDISTCVGCDNCIKTCTHFSDPRVREYELSDLMTIIIENKPYIRGITVSGGEPLEYAEFLVELFREVNSLGLDCLIDSNGHFDFRAYPDLLKESAGVMLDVKAVDNDFHQQLTGQDNKNVLNNLDYLLSINKLFEVRTVLLPGQEKQNKVTISYVVNKIQGRCSYKLIKYRPYGVSEAGKAELGSLELTETEFQSYVKYAEDQGGKCLVLL